MVGRLLARQGLRYVPPGQAAALARQAHAWTLQELEQLLGIPEETLYAWLCQGRLTARQVTTASHPRWLIRADAGDLDRLRTIRSTPRPWKRPAPHQTPRDEF